MKTIFSFLLFFLIFSANSQNFSGEIVYEISVIPKNNSVNLDSILSLKKGSIARYIIKDGYYKSTYFDENEPIYSYTYDDTTKKMYDEMVGSNYITYRDSRKENFQLYNSEIYRDSIKSILGFECFMVSYKSEYGNSKTYYSEEIKVKYESFKGHKVGNWYNKLKEVDGCIAIKTITEFEDYFEIQEAKEIIKKKLSKRKFKITKNKPIFASFSVLDKKVEMIPPTQKQVNCYLDKINLATKEKLNLKSITSYISLIITKDGEIKYIEPYTRDDYGLYEAALDIVENCGFEFNPGEIDGVPISSQALIPIEFKFN